jgi:hypothetical protein
MKLFPSLFFEMRDLLRLNFAVGINSPSVQALAQRAAAVSELASESHQKGPLKDP